MAGEARRMRGVARSDGFVKFRSIRHCIADPWNRQFRRRNHKLDWQPENPKVLCRNETSANFVGKRRSGTS